MIPIIRLFKIARIIARYRLDEFLQTDYVPSSFKLLLKIQCTLLAPQRLWQSSQLSRAERLRKAFEELGPIFIKFGQVLSTRRDLLPDDIADQLAYLQNQVPPFPSEQAVKLIETALGQNIDDIFHSFNQAPLASASVAQVHEATLTDGVDVVVKVIRPHIEHTIRQDIHLMRLLARFIHRFTNEGRRLRLPEVVADYEQTILDELNLQREASNTSQLRRNFKHSRRLYVPEVYWDYTRSNVLVMERIHGIPVTDVKVLNKQKTNMKVLAERGVDIFFTQVFRDNFFHADMHPGNIFVDANDPEAPRYIAIDCAIIGSLTDDDQNYIALNLLAIFNQDYRRFAELHIESGWVPGDTRVHELESAIRTVCEPIFEKPLKDISFGQLLIHLFQTSQRFHMEIQPQLVLLQKTLLNIEGLGRQLYPELDLWQTAKPFLENWLKERISPLKVIRELRNQAPQWIEKLPEVPQMVLDSVQQLSQLDHMAKAQRESLEQLQKQLQDSQIQRGIVYRRIMISSCAILTGLLMDQAGRDYIWQHYPLGTAIILLTMLYWCVRR